MRLTASTVVEAPPAAVAADLADLAGYPEWLGVVLAAVPAPPHGNDAGRAWHVDLGARLGPVRRSKRVRMVRTVTEPDHLRFERVEHDGRTHSAWILDVRLAPGVDGTTVDVVLEHSGGNLPLVELVLREEARRAGRRLAARLATPSGR